MRQNQMRQNKTRRCERETSFCFSLLAFLPLSEKKKRPARLPATADGPKK